MFNKIAGVRMLLAAVAVGGLAGCKKPAGAGASNPTEIPVGEFASISGLTSDFGTMSHDGLTLAFEQVNAAGGELGKKLKLYSEDDGSDPTQAGTVVKKLVDQGVVAVIGEIASSRSLVAVPICEKAKIPMLSPASTNPRVTVDDSGRVRPHIFRICFTDTSQGLVDGQFGASQGWKNVAMLSASDSDYSKGLAESFRKAFDGKGHIVADETYRSTDVEFKPQLQRIMELHPDAVYVPGYYTEMQNILPQAKQVGLTVPFFGGDGWDSPSTLALPAAQGDFYSDHFTASDPRPEVQAFVKAFRDRWHQEPTAMAVLGYDAGLVMADAIKRAGSANPAAITAALGQTKDFHGASGTITIDANHNAQKTIYMLKIEDGKAKLFKAYPPGA